MGVDINKSTKNSSANRMRKKEATAISVHRASFVPLSNSEVEVGNSLNSTEAKHSLGNPINMDVWWKSGRSQLLILENPPFQPQQRDRVNVIM
jgi:hypothetical protein